MPDNYCRLQAASYKILASVITPVPPYLLTPCSDSVLNYHDRSIAIPGHTLKYCSCNFRIPPIPGHTLKYCSSALAPASRYPLHPCSGTILVSHYRKASIPRRTLKCCSSALAPASRYPLHPCSGTILVSHDRKVSIPGRKKPHWLFTNGVLVFYLKRCFGLAAGLYVNP